MLQEKIKAGFCWILTAVCMIVIFWLSSRTAEESAAQSGAILQWFINHFGDNGFTDFIIRKSAHCLEFAGLCLLFNLSLFKTKKVPCPVLSVIFSSLYAVTDEFHQKFVAGRSCELRDWAIDTAGSIAGAICFMIIFALIKYILKKVNSIDRNDN